jgi:hypothetical protein
MAFTNKIREKEIRDIFRYWLERRGPSGAPAQGRIDPRTIPHKHLPNLFLYEHEPEGRFRCKLIGTDIVRVLGKDDTGRYLDEMLDPPTAVETTNLFEQAVTSGRPVYYRYRALTARGERRLFSRILLPVSSGRGRINQIFGMVRYGPAEYRSGRQRSPAADNRLSEVVAATDNDLAAPTADNAAN